MTAPETPPLWVADAEGLSALTAALQGASEIAIDTESNSFHVYFERVCLLQISTRDRHFVVDPFAIDVKPLGEILGDGRVTVFHGADYDIRCLRREYGWSFPRLFDTMLAAKRLGREKLGLSALVESHFGVRLSKDHQRSDWGRRPLTADQITYASADTRYLLPIYDALKAELLERKLIEPAEDEFKKAAAVVARPKVFDAEGWRRLKGARELDPAGKDILRAVWIAREERAKELDRPPFKVLPEQTMVDIARRKPETAEVLQRIPGVTPVVMRRLGDAILAAVKGPARLNTGRD